MVGPKELSKVKKTKERLYRVAVYGTLMEGCVRHNLLRSSVPIGTFQTEPIYSMYSIGLPKSSNSWPYIIKNGNTSISMEVYEFTDEDILKILDSVEQVDNGLFARSIIDTPYGKSFIYTRKEKRMGISDIKILSGSWKEYINYKIA